MIALRAIERLNRFSDHGVESSVCERDEQPANYSADSVVRCQIEGIAAQRHADRESNDRGDDRERDARHKIAILRALLAGEALEVGHLAFHFLASGVGGGADALDA